MSTFKTILVVIAVIVGITYVGGLISTQSQVDDIEKRAQTKTSEPIIPESTAKSNFMETCDTGVLDGVNFDQTVYCECAYREVRKLYTINEIANMEINKSEEDIAIIMEPLANTCVTEQARQIN